MGDHAGGGTATLPKVEHRFYSAGMTSLDPDRVRYAQIAGAAARHAQAWLTAEQEAAAVAELAQAAAGRADLLAECAGTALGFGEGGQDAARYRQIAELCIAAGADPLAHRALDRGRARAGRRREGQAARRSPRNGVAGPAPHGIHAVTWPGPMPGLSWALACRTMPGLSWALVRPGPMRGLSCAFPQTAACFSVRRGAAVSLIWRRDQPNECAGCDSRLRWVLRCGFGQCCRHPMVSSCPAGQG